MRTVDATLTAALASGKGKPYVVGYVGPYTGAATHSEELTYYKLTGNTLEFKMFYNGDFAGAQTHAWIERGMIVAGTKYSITTGRFWIHRQTYQADGSQLCEAQLFPPLYYSASGYDTYQNMITAFLRHSARPPCSRTPAPPGWATGSWHTAKPPPHRCSHMINMCRQKRLIEFVDNGNTTRYDLLRRYPGRRRRHAVPLGPLPSRIDPEAQPPVRVVRRVRASTTQRHRLQIQSTISASSRRADSPPARKTWPYEIDYVIPPDLRYVDGDILKFSMWGGTKLITFFAQIVEEFLPADKQCPVGAHASSAIPSSAGPRAGRASPPPCRSATISRSIRRNSSTRSAPMRTTSRRHSTCWTSAAITFKFSQYEFIRFLNVSTFAVHCHDQRCARRRRRQLQRSHCRQ